MARPTKAEQAAKEAPAITDEMLEETLRGAGESMPEPGTVRVWDVLHTGYEKNPLPSSVSEVSSAGYVRVYDNRTGDPSTINRNMLPTQLKKKRDDGSFIFTLRDPGFRPTIGAVKCRLHADDAERTLWDAWGFAVCGKANLKTEFDRIRHMERRHKTENMAIHEYESRLKGDELEKDRRADREMQRTLLEAIVSRLPKETENAPEPTH